MIIEKTYGRPLVTRDGVTVARESYLEDRKQNQGAQLVIEASQTTNRVAGDGTSATVALTHNLIKLGMQKIAAGTNPMDVKQEILDDSQMALKYLKGMSKKVAKGQLQQVASVSCGDEALGKMIAEAVEKVGSDGGIIAEKALITGVECSYVNGYFLQQGFNAISSGKKELTNPYIVASAKMISSASDVVTLINKVGEQAHLDQNIPLQNPLLQPIQIAFFGEFEGEAYNTIVANIQNKSFDGTITKTPPQGFGEQYLEDLAIYTGGRLVSSGTKLSDVDGSYIGHAEKVSCTATETTVFGGQHADEDMESRTKELKERIKTETNDGIMEKLRDRLAKLENKIALFRIGGATETAREELEFRVEDAVQATRAAASDGIVVGGGMTLVAIAQWEHIGELFRSALENVFKKLVENAAYVPDVALDQANEAPEGFGFNLRGKKNELVDLVDAGILDPTKVVHEVIFNSAQAAADAVSLGAIITFIDKPE